MRQYKAPIGLTCLELGITRTNISNVSKDKVLKKNQTYTIRKSKMGRKGKAVSVFFLIYGIVMACHAI